MTEMSIAAADVRAREHDERTPLERWGARAAVAAPVLSVFSIAASIPILSGELREVAGSPRWVLVTASALMLLMLLGLALIGLYLAQERRLGAAGRASALVALAGTVLAAGGAWDSVFTVPYLAEVAPAVLDRGTSGPLLAGYVGSYLVFVAGWATFAVVTLRARVLAPGPSIALLVGALLAILPAPTAIRTLVLTVAVAVLATRRR